VSGNRNGSFGSNRGFLLLLLLVLGCFRLTGLGPLFVEGSTRTSLGGIDAFIFLLLRVLESSLSEDDELESSEEDTDDELMLDVSLELELESSSSGLLCSFNDFLAEKVRLASVKQLDPW